MRKQKMTIGYWTAVDLSQRFRCTKRTIARWTEREDNPFPAPRLNFHGATALWLIDDILAWEAQFKPITP